MTWVESLSLEQLENVGRTFLDKDHPESNFFNDEYFLNTLEYIGIIISSS